MECHSQVVLRLGSKLTFTSMQLNSASSSIAGSLTAKRLEKSKAKWKHQGLLKVQTKTSSGLLQIMNPSDEGNYSDRTIHFGSRRPSVRNNVSNNQAHALFFQNAFTSWVHRASFLKLCFWTTAIADHVLSPAQGAALSSNDFLSFQFMKCPWLGGKNA